jgi:LAS superfamily LD-carboxypeptidase LdcB
LSIILYFVTLSAPVYAAAPGNGKPAGSAGPEETTTDLPSDANRLYHIPEDMIIYIPIRPLVEQLGGIIEWNSADSSILIISPDGRKISHVPETRVLYINGTQTDAALLSVLQNGVTYFPVPLINQLLGNNAEYDDAANTVTLSSPAPETDQTMLELKRSSELDFYLSENLFRYMDYLTLHPEYALSRAIAYVNAGVDQPFFSNLREIDDPESTLVLCNKHHILPTDYEPDDLTYLSGTAQRLRSEAAAAYEKMKKEAASEGYWFTVYSGYRSYSTQKRLYERYAAVDGADGADDYSARPGHSEHQAGLAIDISAGVREAELGHTETFRWLSENAYRFGFILRYPDGYSEITGYQYEPWHWRYVGIEAATIMHDEQIPTFEEFCGKYLIAR